MRSTSDFCRAVGELVERDYGFSDGADLCRSLLDLHTVAVTDGEERAALIVAQHLAQQ